MAGTSIEVKGAEDLAKVAGAIARNAPELRKELLAGIRKAAKPAVKDVKDAAREKLPQEGGLNLFIANSPVAVRNRTSGKQAGVRIVSTKKGHDIRAFNEGAFRHPVFGNPKVWAPQLIEPGYFTEAIEAQGPRVQKEIVETMDDLLLRIKRESGT